MKISLWTSRSWFINLLEANILQGDQRAQFFVNETLCSLCTMLNFDLSPLPPFRASILKVIKVTCLHCHKHCLTYTNALLHYDTILAHCRVFLCVTTRDTSAQLEFQFKCHPCAVAPRTSVCLEGNSKLQGWALNMFMAEGTIETIHNRFPRGLPVTLFQVPQEKVRLCLKSFFTYIQLQ